MDNGDINPEPKQAGHLSARDMWVQLRARRGIAKCQVIYLIADCQNQAEVFLHGVTVM